MKPQGFADSEDEPDAKRMRVDVAIRRAELTGERRFAQAQDEGRRPVMIGCDPDDTHIQLYRRLGSIDEVHRRRRYDPPAAEA